MRRLIIGGLALAALAGSVATASATPVRNVVAYPYGNSVAITAVAYSPPSAGCGAYFGVQIRSGGSGAVLLRQQIRRFNACRNTTADGYWSIGYPSIVFNRANLPVGTYTVCVGAGQRVNGLKSVHAICRQRSF